MPSPRTPTILMVIRMSAPRRSVTTALCRAAPSRASSTPPAAQPSESGPPRAGLSERAGEETERVVEYDRVSGRPQHVVRPSLGRSVLRDRQLWEERRPVATGGH